jgi:isopenicillin N synthase-like dioxygenase
MPSTDDLQQRFSMAYFVNINGDAIVETMDSCKDNKNGHKTPKYGPILARDHLMAKHLASMEDHVIEEHKSQSSAEKEL